MLERLDRFIRRIFLENLHLKVIAALLTLALYLWVSVDREVERTHQAPVEIEAPEGMVVTNSPPETVGVTVRGKWTDISRLESSQLDPMRVRIDSTMDRQGRIPLNPEMVDLPPGLRAVDVEPNSIRYQIEERHQTTVNIEPTIVGRPANGYTVEEVEVDPDTIEISGPRHSLDEINTVPTESIDVSGRSESFRREVRPRIEDALVEHELEEPIKVDVELEAEEVERTLSDLEVEPVGIDPALATSIEPGRVDVSVRGPKAVVDNLKTDDILASLDLSDTSVDSPHVVEREVEIHNLPDDVELVTTQPSVCRIRLDPEPPDDEDGDDEDREQEEEAEDTE
ncbi:MAG: YbbR-like domain-containing protein [Persicimonas sp.]